MARCQPQKPVIAVIGATGTGKSQLAVELACRFNGEIINSDAMQLYEGLPVITNKITQEEMKAVPHHLLGTITHSEDTWTVTEFVKRALTVVDDIHSRGKLPIIVGGTHYYIQSLLFKESLADGAQQPEEAKPENADSEKYPILEEPTEVILAQLREVDPVMADRWHPNDRRKIQRSLEIWLKTGKPASQLYEEQQSLRKQPADGTEEGAATGTQRFPALLFWVHAANEPLRARLDARVEKMLANGLLSEVDELDRFLQQRESEGHPVDRTRGIWVSIGYKEFEAYQRALTASSADDKELAKLRTQAIEQVQAGTRQYAKRQLRWIRIKLMNALANANAMKSLYLLDGSDLSRWQETVEAPALDVAAKFLDGEPLPEPQSISEAAAEMLTPKREYDLSERRDMWQRRTCETCNTVAVTESDWNKHVQSRGHKVREKKRRQKQAAGVDRPEKQPKEPKEEKDTLAGDVESTMTAFDELVNDQK
ncbi:tRNA dimethylallyltransferase [Lasiodiplodia hormozganensis]|uniref:tRNA dimethylallyltransferase n=2 Tax=Lasiodiplodia hormozganensis TaxID=869390 RepID=A0AA39XQ70_9PEZI|nr:tRNA dimethylallyltransferase [Lasiodiplodia hormozganensis]